MRAGIIFIELERGKTQRRGAPPHQKSEILFKIP
jgi:hypothetical protein